MMRLLNTLVFSLVTATVTAITSTTVSAAIYPYASGETVIVGDLDSVLAKPGDDFAALALEYELGFNALVAANPGNNPWFPNNGTKIILPTKHILPEVEREGIVVNLPEMRLYYFDNDNKRVYTYPVGIGRSGWETPVADTKVTAVEHNPAWRPPQSIIEEYREAGLNLPVVIPSGPENPLGDRAIRLALPGYLLHGTNKPGGVGLRVSHGCIRLYPIHIRELAELVTVGTRVQIINQPIKWAESTQGLQLEAHRPIPMDNPIKIAGHSHLVKQSKQLKSWLANKRKQQRLFSGIPQSVPEY